MIHVAYRGDEMKRQLVLATACAVLVLSVWGFSAGQTVDFPAKGRTITVLVPFPAGGATDIATRMVAETMKSELGTSIQVVNKPGASSQVGMTELARAKADGYTLSASPLPAVILTYLDPDRKAIYTSKSFQPLANVIVPPVVVSVKADSPYRTLQDLVAAAKAGRAHFAELGRRLLDMDETGIEALSHEPATIAL